MNSSQFYFKIILRHFEERFDNHSNILLMAIEMLSQTLLFVREAESKISQLKKSGDIFLPSCVIVLSMGKTNPSGLELPFSINNTPIF